MTKFRFSGDGIVFYDDNGFYIYTDYTCPAPHRRVYYQTYDYDGLGKITPPLNHLL